MLDLNILNENGFENVFFFCHMDYKCACSSVLMDYCFKNIWHE